MAHYKEINDTLTGDLLDVLVFCSDFCHYGWCEENKVEYQGWNGCHELEFDDNCAQCHESIHGVEGAWV